MAIGATAFELAARTATCPESCFHQMHEVMAFKPFPPASEECYPLSLHERCSCPIADNEPEDGLIHRAGEPFHFSLGLWLGTVLARGHSHKPRPMVSEFSTVCLSCSNMAVHIGYLAHMRHQFILLGPLEADVMYAGIPLLHVLPAGLKDPRALLSMTHAAWAGRRGVGDVCRSMSQSPGLALRWCKGDLWRGRGGREGSGGLGRHASMKPRSSGSALTLWEGILGAPPRRLPPPSVIPWTRAIWPTFPISPPGVSGASTGCSVDCLEPPFPIARYLPCPATPKQHPLGCPGNCFPELKGRRWSASILQICH